MHKKRIELKIEDLETQFKIIYDRRKDYEKEGLCTIGKFKGMARWMKSEIEPVAAYISESRKQAWPLYRLDAVEPLKKKYPARFRNESDADTNCGCVISERWLEFLGLDTLKPEPFIEYDSYIYGWCRKYFIKYEDYFLCSTVNFINQLAHKVEVAKEGRQFLVTDTVEKSPKRQNGKQLYDDLKVRKNLPRPCKYCKTYPTILTNKEHQYPKFGVKVCCDEIGGGSRNIEGAEISVLYSGSDFASLLNDWNYRN